jgi:hypothetical protein
VKDAASFHLHLAFHFVKYNNYGERSWHFSMKRAIFEGEGGSEGFNEG